MSCDYLYVILKPTLLCNLACHYCYAREDCQKGQVMSRNEIIQAIDFICNYAKLSRMTHVRLCWHGGEPFSLDTRIFASSLDYARKKFAQEKLALHQTVQTNLTLLNDEKIELTKEFFSGRLGVSVDIGTHLRVDHAGNDMEDTIIEKLDYAIENGIKCAAITQITKNNLHDIEKIYRFFKDREMFVRLSRIFPISADYDRDDSMYLTDQEYAQAEIDFFNIWTTDPHPMRNDENIHLLGDLLLGRPSLCVRQENCQQVYLSIAPGGKIFPCGEFDTADAEIGNYLKQTPEEFLASDSRNGFYKKYPVPKSCFSCRSCKTCYGGCLHDRCIAGYPYKCKSNKIYWDYLVHWLKERGLGLYALEKATPEEAAKTMAHLLKPGP